MLRVRRSRSQPTSRLDRSGALADECPHKVRLTYSCAASGHGALRTRGGVDFVIVAGLISAADFCDATSEKKDRDRLFILFDQPNIGAAALSRRQSSRTDSVRKVRESCVLTGGDGLRPALEPAGSALARLGGGRRAGYSAA
jgi:hypothetical protein